MIKKGKIKFKIRFHTYKNNYNYIKINEKRKNK